MPQLTLDDAISFTISDLQRTVGQTNRNEDYGYDIWPPNVAGRWVARQNNGHNFQNETAVRGCAPVFYDAAWELCRRGIVRPGVKTTGAQAIDDGGYSLTQQGRIWIENHNATGYVPLESGSLAQVLGTYQARFGDAFHQRSQEAVRCRHCEAWLACCAMVGAASESILLKLAVGKVKDEEAVLSQYYSRSGRKNVMNILVGKAPKSISSQLETFMGLLAYWRDEAAHGQLSVLSVANADEALRQLLHLAQWADGNWDLLTSKN
jgi:hypothetical protein